MICVLCVQFWRPCLVLHFLWQLCFDSLTAFVTTWWRGCHLLCWCQGKAKIQTSAQLLFFSFPKIKSAIYLLPRQLYSYKTRICYRNNLVSVTLPFIIVYEFIIFIVMYVSCKQIMSYFLSLKYVNIDFRFSFDRSPRTLTENNRRVESQAIWKVHGQKRKSVTHTQQAVHSVGVTQLGCDMGFCMVSPASPVLVSLVCFLFMLVLPGESPVSDLGRGVTRALLKGQLCLFPMNPCQLSASIHKFRFFHAVPCLLFTTDLGLLGYW